MSQAKEPQSPAAAAAPESSAPSAPSISHSSSAATPTAEARARVASITALVRTHLAGPTPDSFAIVTEALADLRTIDTADTAEERVQCMLDAAQFFYVTGQPFIGISSVQQGIAIAENTPNKMLLRRACTALGILCADTGNIPMAIEAYVRSLELAQHLKDASGECAIWNNLGLALHYAAQYDEAIRCFQHGVAIAENNKALLPMRVSALTNIGLSCLHLEDFHLGLRSLEEAVRINSEPASVNDYLSRTILETHFTRLLLEVDNFEKARQHSEMARAYAAKARTVRADTMAAVAEGLCEVHAGMKDVGLSRLTMALEKARLLRSALGDTLIAMVKAQEAAGQPERALVYLRELLEHTRKLQQENALRHLKLLEQVNNDVSGAISIPPTSALERREAVLRGKIAEQELFKARVEMLERLAVAAELRDDSTGEHSYRVGKLSALLAAEYGCDDDTIVMLDLAGRLHDIGKIGVPDAILLKNGKLNDAERQIMRAHTTVGAELLAKSNIAQMQMAEEIARYHHEWWDGTGYPSNLSGTAIPLAARITALADVYDALSHKRPYKDAWSIDDTLTEIYALRGKQFDPELTVIFVALVERLRTEHEDLDAYLGQAARQSPFLQARSKIWDTLATNPDLDAARLGLPIG